MDHDTIWLIFKIVATAGSFLFLFIYKKKIKKMATDLIVGGDTGPYEGRSFIEIRKDMEDKMDEVLR